MKFYILSLVLIFLALVQAEVLLNYKFKNAAAKTLFDDQKGSECVHNAIKVQNCGLEHLVNKNPSDTAGYETCVKEIKCPSDFEVEALALKASDFQSKAIFEDSYNRKLLKYAESLDKKFSDPEKASTMEFSFNWLAWLIIPIAFGIVYFLNKRGQSADSQNSPV